ncbi:TetR/AcrR family transcriptional regulator [Shewanella sp. JM162201]|uniref:TetR/AcrR family transcriptional regulator n=1 Tax=Shewanella jiangmenensis TaxID=2837387 RepID=A0ABS5V8L9_9GAMM|nr:TetR/AcrR family transcriptional regulator [Shewanella jiangmenensis]
MSKSEHILDVAERLFNEFGYTAVGVDLIRDEAQVSKTSMYRHFGSKSLLIEAVLARRHQSFEASLGSALAESWAAGELVDPSKHAVPLKHTDSAGGSKLAKGADTAQARLDLLLNWHFDWFARPDFKGCMFMHALAEFKGVDDGIAAKAIQHKAWLKSLIAGIVGPGSADAAVRIESLMTFIEGMIVRAEFGEVLGNTELYRRAAMNLLRA